MADGVNSKTSRYITYRTRTEVWHFMTYILIFAIGIPVTVIITWMYVPESTRAKPFHGNPMAQDFGFLISSCYSVDYSPARQIGAILWAVGFCGYLIYAILSVAHTNAFSNNPAVPHIGEGWRKFRLYSAMVKVPCVFSVIYGAILWSPNEDGGGFYTMSQLVFFHGMGFAVYTFARILDEWERIHFTIHLSYDLGVSVIPFNDWLGDKTKTVLNLYLVFFTCVHGIIGVVLIFWAFGSLSLIYDNEDIRYIIFLRSQGFSYMLITIFASPLISFKIMNCVPALVMRTLTSDEEIMDRPNASSLDELRAGCKEVEDANVKKRYQQP